MIGRIRFARLSLLASCAGLVAASCISPDSPLIEESAEGCEELSSGGDFESLNVNPRVKRLMKASVDFKAVVDDMKDNVLVACANIARDLGAEDSWSGIENFDQKISNSEGTGACDRAGQRLEELLDQAGPVTIAVAVSKGECHFDFEEQRRCDQECSVQQTCDSGSVETRCEPGSLSVVCEGSCQAQATCVGSPELPANCMGKCESECVGQCQGTCVHKDGRTSENDPNCVGKCSSSCNGTCRGLCKIEKPEGVQCGSNVHCTGGCTASYTNPVCTSVFTPPSCQLDQECHDVCTSSMVARAVCDPTQIDVMVDLTTHPALQPLADTLEQNLPALVDAAEKQGKLAQGALRRLGEAGNQLQGHVDELDGKSVACAAETGTLLARTIGTAEVTVDASVRFNLIIQERTE